MLNPIESLVSDLMSLGGRPAGDPDAIFVQAQKLEQLAARLSTTTRLLAHQEPIAYYEGPQAHDYQVDVREQVNTLRGTAEYMQTQAASLFAASARLAHDQVTWDQGFTRKVNGIPSGIVNQAKRIVGWL